MASYLGHYLPTMVIKSIFGKYDTDDSGYLSKCELVTLMKEDLRMSKRDIEAFSLLMDKDASHRISFEEFAGWIQDPNQSGLLMNPTGSKYHILMKAVEYFKQFDQDQSGALEQEEFVKLMKSIGVKDEAIGAALNGIDKNHDGQVSFYEFLKWLNWLPADELELSD
eukprot:gene9673-10659_t